MDTNLCVKRSPCVLNCSVTIKALISTIGFFLDKVDLWFTSFWVKENFGLPRLKRIYLVSKKREGFIWIWIFLGGHFGSTKLANDYIGF
jgi:hypothetical protein